MRRLEQIEEARAVQARYAELIDAQCIDRLDEVFAPDAVLTASTRRFEGLSAIQEYYRGANANDPSQRRHFLTNVAVIGADNEHVTLGASFLYVAGTGGESILGWGRYVDTFRCAGVDTRMLSKNIEVHYRGPVAAGWGEHAAAVVAPTTGGQPDGHDPVAGG